MNNRSPCPTWAELFATDNREDLAPYDRMALEEHLLSCSTCAHTFQSYEILRSRFRDMVACVRKPPLTTQLLALQAMIVRRRESEQPRAFTHNQTLSDEALLEAIAGGAVWAVEEIYQRYSIMLYSLAYCIVSDHKVAEDILQETFLAIWQHTSSYSPQAGTARSWLIAILRHRAIDYLPSFRRSTLKEARVGEVESEVCLNIASREPEPWEMTRYMVKAEQVHTALLQLRSVERLMLELAVFQCRTHIEIAKGIQMPPSTVKTQMRQGIHHFKGLLDEMGISEEGSFLTR